MNATQSNSARPDRQTTCTVAIYPHGTITDRGHLEILKWKSGAEHKGGRRSAITTFSRQSAARFRQRLAQIIGPKGWLCFGMTLTVPGPNITPEEWDRLWCAYCQRLRRMGYVALIWRIELQTRGQPHVHCICWSKDGPDKIRTAWFEALGLLGPYEGPAVTVKGLAKAATGENGETAPQELMRVSHRAFWPGACEHAVRVDSIGSEDNMGWWRYLASHASKSKQAQLGWKGRQWGIVNERHLDRAIPILIELTQKAEAKFIRYMPKLNRCRFASPHGKQTWFGLTSNVMRLCRWATEACRV